MISFLLAQNEDIHLISVFKNKEEVNFVTCIFMSLSNLSKNIMYKRKLRFLKDLIVNFF